MAKKETKQVKKEVKPAKKVVKKQAEPKKPVKKVEAKKEAKPKKEVKKQEPKKEIKKEPVQKAPIQKAPKKFANNDNVKEPVVKAEFEENNIKKPQKKLNKKELFRMNVQNGQEHSTQGVFSNEFNDAMDNNKSANEIKYADYRTLSRARKNGDVLWGKVINVIPEPTTGKWFVEVLYNTMIVRIPEDTFFEKGYFFGKSYPAKSAKEQRKWRKTVLNRYIEAFVCFTVVSTNEINIKEGDFKGETIYTAIGNRNAAMDIFKDIYFFHRNRKEQKSKPRQLNIGDSVPCRVVDVTFNNVTVECCGVETRISSNELSDEYIADCSARVHVGDIKNFFVKGIEVKENKISLVLTGRTQATPSAILTMVKGGSYAGTVVFYNEEKDIYSVVLDNKVTASVYRNNVIGFSELALGSRVSVTVTEIQQSHVSGNCIKIN